jgi:hypothetical protein
MSSATLSIIGDYAIGVAIIAGGIVLLALGKIDQPTGIAVIGAGAAIAKGANAAAIALKVPAPTPPPPPPVQ